MNNNTARIEELQAKIDRILNIAKTYKTCRDGSYEACLHFEGYYSLKKELDELLDRPTVLT